MNEIRISDPMLRKMVYAIGIMGIIAFGFYTVGLLKTTIQVVLNVLTPFIAALLMAYILAPLVVALQDRLRLGRIKGTLALYAIIFLVVFVFLGFLIPKVLSEFVRLFHAIKTSAPDFFAEIARNRHIQIDMELIETLEKRFRDIQVDYESVLESVLPGLKRVATGGLQAMGKATAGIFSGLSSFFAFFSFLMFVGIIAFYFIVDWEKIGPFLRKIVPPAHRDRTFDIMRKVDIAVGGFLRGQLTVSVIVGASFAVGLFMLGFAGFAGLRNYCLLIGTAAAIGGFIPYLGPIIGVTPAILIVLFTGGPSWTIKLITLLTVLGLFAAIQAVEGFVLQPKIVGKGAGLHPLAVMLALLAGAQFGIGGMIIAVPLASVIRVLVLEFYWLPVLKRESELETEI